MTIEEMVHEINDRRENELRRHGAQWVEENIDGKVIQYLDDADVEWYYGMLFPS